MMPSHLWSRTSTGASRLLAPVTLFESLEASSQLFSQVRTLKENGGKHLESLEIASKMTDTTLQLLYLTPRQDQHDNADTMSVCGTVESTTTPLDLNSALDRASRSFIDGSGGKDHVLLNRYVFLDTNIAPHPFSSSYSLSGSLSVPDCECRLVPIQPLRLATGPLTTSLEDGSAATGSSGYLTIDPMRNLVPLLDTDAFSYNSSLTGIWMVIDTRVTPFEQSVDLWAACLRFLYCDYIKDRVSVAPLTFLVQVFDAGTDIRPCLYECTATLGPSMLTQFCFSSDITLPSKPSTQPRIFRLPLALHRENTAGVPLGLLDCNQQYFDVIQHAETFPSTGQGPLIHEPTSSTRYYTDEKATLKISAQNLLPNPSLPVTLTSELDSAPDLLLNPELRSMLQNKLAQLQKTGHDITSTAVTEGTLPATAQLLRGHGSSLFRANSKQVSTVVDDDDDRKKLELLSSLSISSSSNPSSTPSRAKAFARHRAAKRHHRKQRSASKHHHKDRHSKTLSQVQLAQSAEFPFSAPQKSPNTSVENYFTKLPRNGGKNNTTRHDGIPRPRQPPSPHPHPFSTSMSNVSSIRNSMRSSGGHLSLGSATAAASAPYFPQFDTSQHSNMDQNARYLTMLQQTQAQVASLSATVAALSSSLKTTQDDNMRLRASQEWMKAQSNASSPSTSEPPAQQQQQQSVQSQPNECEKKQLTKLQPSESPNFKPVTFTAGEYNDSNDENAAVVSDVHRSQDLRATTPRSKYTMASIHDVSSDDDISHSHSDHEVGPSPTYLRLSHDFSMEKQWQQHTEFSVPRITYETDNFTELSDNDAGIVAKYMAAGLPSASDTEEQDDVDDDTNLLIGQLRLTATGDVYAFDSNAEFTETGAEEYDQEIEQLALTQQLDTADDDLSDNEYYDVVNY